MFNRFPFKIEDDGGSHPNPGAPHLNPFPFLFRFPHFGLNPPLIPNLSAFLEAKSRQHQKELSSGLHAAIRPVMSNGADKERKKHVQKSAKQIQVQIINGNQDNGVINVTLRHTEDTDALEKASREKCQNLSIITVTAGDSTSSNVVYTGMYSLKEGQNLDIAPAWLALCHHSDQEADANVGDCGEVLVQLDFGDEIVLLKRDESTSTVDSEASVKQQHEELFKFDLDSILKTEKPATPLPPATTPSTTPSTAATTSGSGFQCNRCGKMFSYAYYRDKHLKYTRCVDNGDRKYPCPLCTRSFEKRDRLRIHILHVHENHRPHGCSVCGKSFSQSSSLNKHLRVHSGERPYLCPFCSKSFTASSILRTHIRQHSGEKPFKCTFCGKSFASHAAHDSHVRRSHSDQNTVNLYKCQFCDKCFDHQHHLLFHNQCFHSSELAPSFNDVDGSVDGTVDDLVDEIAGSILD